MPLAAPRPDLVVGLFLRRMSATERLFASRPIPMPRSLTFAQSLGP